MVTRRNRKKEILMKTQSRLLMIGAALALVGALPLSAQVVIHVPDDFPNIQAGLSAASPGDTVLVAPGTYTGVNNRNLNFYGKGVALVSEQGPDVTIIDAQHLGRCFVITNSEGPDTIIDGFTIRNGETISGTGALDGGGIYCNGSSPVIRNCVITSCLADRSGGGMYASITGRPFIDSCTFSFNGSGETGGGFAGEAVIWNTDFRSNEANDTYNVKADGGGAYLTGGSEVKGCRFVSNNACRGGAIYLASGDVENSLFFNNTAYTQCSTLNRGGAIFSDAAGDWVVFSTFKANDAIHEGDSIFSNYGTFNVKHSIIWDSYSNGLAWDPSDAAISATYSNITYNSGTYPGTGNLNIDPRFVTGPGSSPENGVYLSQIAAGQVADSQCINAGQYVSSTWFFCDIGYGEDVCMDELTTRTDLGADQGTVDFGYHHYFGLVFADGFENGNTGGWSETSP